MVDRIRNFFGGAILGKAGNGDRRGFPNKELMENLFYMRTHTKLDVSFSVNLLRRFVKLLLQMYWTSAKRAWRYLVDTIHRENLRK